MAYGLRYNADFDNVANTRYTIEIWKKDYEGDSREIILAGVPALHSWSTDDPKAPIKGSSLVVNLLNEGGEESQTDFSASVYPRYDEFAENPSYMFISSTSFVPEVGVPFTVTGYSEAEINISYTPTVVGSTGPGSWFVAVADGEILLVGGSPETVTIISSALDTSTGLPLTTFYSEEDDTFKVRLYEETQLKFEGFLVQDDCTELMADYIHEISLSFTDNLGLLKDVALDMELDRVPLLEIIATCIQNTGLELDTFIYANIFETTHDTGTNFLEQTYVDTQTFYKEETFDNCYNVLTSIFERFNLTLFQADGAWRIVRWDEIRYDLAIPYFQYDSTFTEIGTGALDSDIMTGFEEAVYPQTGLLRSVFRPYKFDKETFDYVIPKYLLRNFDLQDLGALINTYTDGPNTINEYEFTDWNPGGFSPQPNYFIRVVTETGTDIELERYVVVEDATGDTARSVVAIPFEVSVGDRIELRYTFRTTVSQAGSSTVQLAVELTDGVTTNYADEDPAVGWKVGLGWNYTWPSGTNTLDNQSVIIDPPPIPFDGLIYIYLPQAVLSSPGPGDETQIKDIRLTYTPYINDSFKIIGHTHKREQEKTIKNTEDVDVFLDDSPKNSIIGTLFRESFTGVLRNKTTRWYRLSNPSELLRIGEITTLEQMLWRRKPRTKLEGTFYGVLGISMLSTIKHNAFEELNFLFGSLEIEYKNNNMACTMWEMFEDGDEDGDLAANYTFTYLYNSR